MKYRKLRIAYSVMCSVACLLLLALWLRSYWRLDSLEGPMLWPSGFWVTSETGCVALASGDEHEKITEWEFDSSELSAPSVNPYLSGSLQFQAPVFALNSSVEDGTYIRMPHWFLVQIFALLAFVFVNRRRYSLRTLLIVVTLIALELGAIGYYIAHADWGGGFGGGGGGLADSQEIRSLASGHAGYSLDLTI